MSLTEQAWSRLTDEERLALRVAIGQVTRQEAPGVNTAAMLVLTIERLLNPTKPAVNEHGALLCPLHAPDDPYSDRELYVVRESYTPLDAVDLERSPRKEYPFGMGIAPWPGEPTSTGWRVQCVGGHVLANPGGDSEANEDTDRPTDDEWALLRALLTTPPTQGATP